VCQEPETRHETEAKYYRTFKSEIVCLTTFILL